MATLDTFKLLVAETSGVADVTLSSFITQATLRLDSTQWGSCYEQAVCYMAGHLLCLSPSNPRRPSSSTHAGPVASESTGGLSRSYATPSTGRTGDAMLAITDPGREFLALRDQVVIGATIIDMR